MKNSNAIFWVNFKNCVLSCKLQLAFTFEFLDQKLRFGTVWLHLSICLSVPPRKTPFLWPTDTLHYQCSSALEHRCIRLSFPQGGIFNGGKLGESPFLINGSSRCFLIAILSVAAASSNFLPKDIFFSEIRIVFCNFRTTLKMSFHKGLMIWFFSDFFRSFITDQ